jgi:uncharacterized protein
VNHRFTIILVLAAMALARAQDAPPIARYVPAAPDRRHVFVTDSAHILSAAEIRSLQDSAQALQSETGADVAWVTLPTLGGRAIEEASVYLGRAWKIGSNGQPGDEFRNRGLVILYVPNKSATAGSNFRVEVGKGLQGTIIDSRSRAISNAMRDDLRAKRYDDGYRHGWTVAAAMVREDFASRGRAAAPAAVAATAPIPRPTDDGNGGKALPFILLALFCGWVVMLIARRSRAVGMSVPTILLAAMDDDDDDERRRRDDDSGGSSWLSGGSSDSGSSGDSGGGDFGGGGGFDGGGSSDSI